HPRREPVRRQLIPEWHPEPISQHLYRRRPVLAIAVHRRPVVARVEFEIRAMAVRVTVAGESIGDRAFVEKRDMESLLKTVLEDLPVRVDLRRPRVAGGGELGERVA